AASIVRKANMDITKRRMDTDPQTRLLYSDWFFSLSNVQEFEEGEVECCNRFEVVEKMRKADEELQAWIVADPVRKEKWGELLSELDRKWSSLDGFLKSETYARETLIRSSRLGIVCIRLHSNLKNAKNRLVSDIEELDLRVEKDIYRSSLRLFFENVDSKYWSEFHTALRQQYGNDYESMCNDTWAASLFESKDKIKAFADSDASISDDPVYEFYTSLEMSELNKIEVSLDPTPNRTELGHEYTKALYQMREEKGIPQYPDANSSMRLTYGTVGGIEPFDAVVCSWASTSKGILEKYDPEDYDFSLKPEWKEIVGTYDGTVNFITDNDITGGNSGSAVLNAEGQLVGLAFDGNKESLASDVYYTPGYNKCVCVDIRYVVFILRAHHFDRILSELALD
ncbi:MAG: S46 family peptidase, partial [Bacteroidales bacterium]|nr:S46 family peptidase [Candidatus Cryptobacteroides caccocaballi]